MKKLKDVLIVKLLKIIGDNKKKIHIAISFLFSLKIKIAGAVKKDIHSMLKAYVPMKDVI